MALIICAISTQSQAEEFALGPANIYLDMGLVPEPYRVIGDSISDFHDTWTGRINCTVYPAYIGHSREVELQLHRLEEPTAIDLSMIAEILYTSGLLPAGWNTERSNISVSGRRGILVNATGPRGLMVQLAGFSPDAGARSGRIIFLFKSNLRWNCTHALLESIRINILL